MKSASRRGRTLASASSSASSTYGETRSSALIASRPDRRQRSSGTSEQPDRLAQQHRHRRHLAVDRLRDRGHRLIRLGGRPAERQHALADLVLPLAGENTRRPLRGEDRADPVAQLEDQAFGALLADPGYPGESGDVAARDGTPYGIGVMYREDRLGEPRTDAARRLEH